MFLLPQAGGNAKTFINKKNDKKAPSVFLLKGLTLSRVCD
jgi:hypothetical protein